MVTRFNKALRKADFRRGKRLGKNDHLVRWGKPSMRDIDRETYRSFPDFITVRECKFYVDRAYASSWGEPSPSYPSFKPSDRIRYCVEFLLTNSVGARHRVIEPLFSVVGAYGRKSETRRIHPSLAGGRAFRVGIRLRVNLRISRC